MKPENKEPKWLGNMSLQEVRKAHDENVLNDDNPDNEGELFCHCGESIDPAVMFCINCRE